MVRILETSSPEEELGKQGTFHPKKRRLTGKLRVILSEESKLVLPIFQMAKLEGMGNVQRNRFLVQLKGRT